MSGTLFSLDKVWEITTAASALLTVLAVFVLPIISNYIVTRNAQKLVSEELRRSYETCRQICSKWEEFNGRNTEKHNSNEFVLITELLSRTISTNLWEMFRYKVGADAYWCFEPFYTSISYIKDPYQGFASDGPSLAADRIKSSKLRAFQAGEFIKEFELTAAKCRYFRT